MNYKNNKTAYEGRDLIGEIDASINLLCMEFGRCTPTDVLRLAKIEETNTTRQIVIDVAKRAEFEVKSSGRGFVILDW